MRQLNRLNQYHRLWQPSQGATQQVTISELAARCFCSERHVRTLLRQAQEAGWLSWRAQSGRGKRGELTFHVAPESLRNAMMEEALKSGQQHNALELAQLAPEALRSLLHPFWAGSGKTTRRRCASPTIALWSRFSRVFTGPGRAASGGTGVFRPDAF
ncbi:peptide ABC transporter substrate-binding protein [Enterobacter asburiae]|nr:peptide ABC transporter substrate-binding protein [Enterobacter asburiae]